MPKPTGDEKKDDTVPSSAPLRIQLIEPISDNLTMTEYCSGFCTGLLTLR